MAIFQSMEMIFGKVGSENTTIADIDGVGSQAFSALIQVRMRSCCLGRNHCNHTIRLVLHFVWRIITNCVHRQRRCGCHSAKLTWLKE